MITQTIINRMGILVGQIPFLRAIGHLEPSSVGTVVCIAEGDGHEAEDSPCDI